MIRTLKLVIAVLAILELSACGSTLQVHKTPVEGRRQEGYSQSFTYNQGFLGRRFGKVAIDTAGGVCIVQATVSGQHFTTETHTITPPARWEKPIPLVITSTIPNPVNVLVSNADPTCQNGQVPASATFYDIPGATNVLEVPVGMYFYKKPPGQK